ncbi:rCG25132 [Rattus norvegicus]|uniref:RCG25132 n=1 Tax=Rattus norvegicus TaxID=10116 RepID=A6I441_RAT|nr:rCG25132 [Rattus norvegicus]
MPAKESCRSSVETRQRSVLQSIKIGVQDGSLSNLFPPSLRLDLHNTSISSCQLALFISVLQGNTSSLLMETRREVCRK